MWLIVQLPIEAGGWDAPLTFLGNLQDLRLCASSYFYLIVSWEMTRGNDLNGKHDEWKFGGLNIVWVETILDCSFWIGVIREGIFWVVIMLGGNFPGGNCLGGVILGGNCPGGSYLWWEFSKVGIFRVETVRWESSGWQFSRWEFS